jgi:hypothetical protein
VHHRSRPIGTISSSLLVVAVALVAFVVLDLGSAVSSVAATVSVSDSLRKVEQPAVAERKSNEASVLLTKWEETLHCLSTTDCMQCTNDNGNPQCGTVNTYVCTSGTYYIPACCNLTNFNPTTCTFNSSPTCSPTKCDQCCAP